MNCKKLTCQMSKLIIDKSCLIAVVTLALCSKDPSVYRTLAVMFWTVFADSTEHLYHPPWMCVDRLGRESSALTHWIWSELAEKLMAGFYNLFASSSSLLAFCIFQCMHILGVQIRSFLVALWPAVDRPVFTLFSNFQASCERKGKVVLMLSCCLICGGKILEFVHGIWGRMLLTNDT